MRKTDNEGQKSLPGFEAAIPVLVSRCLMGVPCRYHGRTPMRATPGVPHSRILALQRTGKYKIIDVCPECDAGLPVPRPPTRWKGDRLICDGVDVTETFRLGAKLTLAVALASGAQKAFLVRGSPSCDQQSGVAATLLAKHGVKIVPV
jgi:purine-nucleoside phosphorylase